MPRMVPRRLSPDMAETLTATSDARQRSPARGPQTGCMTTTTTTYVVHALPAAILAQVRSSRLDASGNPVERAVARGGEPLRCCLRDAEPGEALLLFGYSPPAARGPYREVGAVFAHADQCTGFAGTGYPSRLAPAATGAARVRQSRLDPPRDDRARRLRPRVRDRRGPRSLRCRGGAQSQHRPRLLHVRCQPPADHSDASVAGGARWTTLRHVVCPCSISCVPARPASAVPRKRP